jgi:hypothetical protein
VLSGTPTATGNFSFSIIVNDSSSPSLSATRNFTLSVSGQLTITTNTLPNGAVGRSYSQTISASGGLPPYFFGVISGAMPGGLTLSSDGVMSGTPTTSGNITITVAVSDSSATQQTATKNFSFVIQPQLTVTTSSLPTGTVGVFYSQLLTANITSNLTWTIVSGIAPPGLSLSTSGALSGNPQVGGQFDLLCRPRAPIRRKLRLKRFTWP